MELRNSKKAFQNERFRFTSPLGKQILCAPKEHQGLRHKETLLVVIFYVIPRKTHFRWTKGMAKDILKSNPYISTTTIKIHMIYASKKNLKSSIYILTSTINMYILYDPQRNAF